MRQYNNIVISVAMVLFILISGCMGIGADQSEFQEKHEVSIYNIQDGTHVLSVTVTNGTNQVLFDETYELASRAGDESRHFTGTPETITVSTGDGVTREFQWEPGPELDEDSECPGDASVGIEIWHEADGTYNSTGGDKKKYPFVIRFTCDNSNQ